MPALFTLPSGSVSVVVETAGPGACCFNFQSVAESPAAAVLGRAVDIESDPNSMKNKDRAKIFASGLQKQSGSMILYKQRNNRQIVRSQTKYQKPHLSICDRD